MVESVWRVSHAEAADRPSIHQRPRFSICHRTSSARGVLFFLSRQCSILSRQSSLLSRQCSILLLAAWLTCSSPVNPPSQDKTSLPQHLSPLLPPRHSLRTCALSASPLCSVSTPIAAADSSLGARHTIPSPLQPHPPMTPTPPHPSPLGAAFLLDSSWEVPT